MMEGGESVTSYSPKPGDCPQFTSDVDDVANELWGAAVDMVICRRNYDQAFDRADYDALLVEQRKWFDAMHVFNEVVGKVITYR